MHVTEIALVQGTWGMITSIADDAAKLFYARLFELDPSLAAMFSRTDMTEQRKKLMQMITVVVRGLGRLEELLPAIRALGERHVAYGVRDEHYDTVGAALLWALEQGLGERFTPTVREAWSTTYNSLASVMRSAAHKKAA